MTALISHQPSHNLTVLVAGLQNGQVKLLKVHQRISRCFFLASSSGMTMRFIFK